MIELFLKNEYDNEMFSQKYNALMDEVFIFLQKNLNIVFYI